MNQDFLDYQEELEREIHQIWAPHWGQYDIVKSLLIDWSLGVFLQCGRKFGKTELAVYLLYMFGLLFENAECYFVCDEKDHGRKILWDNGRLPRFFTSFRRLRNETVEDYQERKRIGEKLSSKYIKSINNVNMSVTLHNDSMIMVEGAKNFSKADGLSPTFVVYDEFKHHDKRFDIAMRPNLRTFNGRILILGTPPDNEDNYYCDVVDEFIHKKDHHWFQRPSYMNPHVYTGKDDEGLLEEEKAYRRRGEYHVFAREYLAEIMPDDNARIFPMFDKTKHIGKYDDMVAEVRRSYRDWDFYISFDPATTSVFGVLLVAINSLDKRVWLLDEIYEDRAMQTRAKPMWELARKKWREISAYDDDWYKLYDYAAAHFQVEIQAEFDENIHPCTKDMKNKESKLSVIKDLMIYDRFKASDRCVKDKKGVVWEINKYAKDENGMIPKKDDHNIDNLRYILNAAYYTSVPTEPLRLDQGRRAYSMQEDMVLDHSAEALLGGVGHDRDFDDY